MENRINYSRLTEKIIAGIEKDRAGESGDPADRLPPRLLLHSCCAPCSSHCMEYLREHFRLTVFYYNPNITVQEEYEKRLAEEKRLIAAYNRQVEEQDFTGMHSTPAANRIDILEAPYDPDNWFEAVRGLENCPEGGERCAVCFEMRLRAAARAAAGEGHSLGSFDYFTTTLTISPLKNAALLNEIGKRMAEKYGVDWLPSDFKKKDGYKRSIELSRAFDLYRQNYCGCVFSRSREESSPVSGTRGTVLRSLSPT
ncbi:MAG: epoxyqueuosine reductase QueH [Eubacteriales bacterium]|nr:epoxyqueuosine reductase QueH [Eubacteriales bacterium]